MTSNDPGKVSLIAQLRADGQTASDEEVMNAAADALEFAESEIVRLKKEWGAALDERDEARNVLANISIAVAYKERKVGQPWDEFLGEDTANSILVAVQEWIQAEDAEYEHTKIVQRNAVRDAIWSILEDRLEDDIDLDLNDPKESKRFIALVDSLVEAVVKALDTA